MKIASLQQELQQNSYPGRGIVLGRSETTLSPHTLLWEEVKTAATVSL